MAKIEVGKYSKFESGENHRADVYMPMLDLFWGMSLLVVGIISCIEFAIAGGIGWFLFFFYGSFLGFLGMFSVLRWKNQMIIVISDDEFEYSSIFGKKKRYYFNEIKDVIYPQHRGNYFTLFIPGKSINLSMWVLISNRFARLVNEATERNK